MEASSFAMQETDTHEHDRPIGRGGIWSIFHPGFGEVIPRPTSAPTSRHPFFAPDMSVAAMNSAAAAAVMPKLTFDQALQGNFPPSAEIDGGDLFGFGFSLDGRELFVGAPASQANGVDLAGASYFFERATDAPAGVAWTQSQAPFVGTEINDAIGLGHYASGDDWLFVPSANGQTTPGEVLVFRKLVSACGSETPPPPPPAWQLFQRIQGTAGTRENPLFGYNLSYSSGRLLVSPLNGSSAFVYEPNGPSGEWVRIAELSLPLPHGTTSALITDALLLGGTQAFVGYTPALDFGIASKGRVAVFVRIAKDTCDDSCQTLPPGSWQLSQTLTGSDVDEETIDLFGASLSAERHTLVVGAPFDPTILPAGAVYIFRRCEGRWLLSQKILSQPADQDPPCPDSAGFGLNVAIHRGLLAIADPERQVGNNQQQGVVNLYVRLPCNGEWVTVDADATLTDPSGFSGELFGAGEIQISDHFVVVSNSLSQLFVGSPSCIGNNPGRVVIWQRQKRCESSSSSKTPHPSKKRSKHRKHRE